MIGSRWSRGRCRLGIPLCLNGFKGPDDEMNDATILHSCEGGGVGETGGQGEKR